MASIPIEFSKMPSLSSQGSASILFLSLLCCCPTVSYTIARAPSGNVLYTLIPTCGPFGTTLVLVVVHVLDPSAVFRLTSRSVHSVGEIQTAISILSSLDYYQMRFSLQTLRRAHFLQPLTRSPTCSSKPNPRIFTRIRISHDIFPCSACESYALLLTNVQN